MLDFAGCKRITAAFFVASAVLLSSCSHIDLGKQFMWRTASIKSTGKGAQASVPEPVADSSSPAERMTIAVADLSAEGVSSSDAAIIAELLRNELVNTGAFKVVEKTNMDKLLAEQAFQQTGCTSEECAVKLGKLLNVQAIAVGSFGKLLDKYFINLRIVKVETGEIVFSDSAKGNDADEIEAAARNISERISSAFGS